MPGSTLLVIGVAVALCLLVPPLWLGAAAAVCVGATLAFWTGVSALSGNIVPITVTWVLLFPLAPYFLSVPHARPLFTLDRAVAGLLLLAVALAGSGRTAKLSRTLRLAAGAWFAFLIAAALSLLSVQEVAPAARVLVDAFMLPALLALGLLRCLDVPRSLLWLHAAACVMCMYSAAIGVAETLSGQDLLALPGAGSYFDTGVGILRVNGPFQTNHSFALIGLISLFVLLFLWETSASRMSRLQRALHWLGTAAALVMALLPMFRSVMLTLVLVAVIAALRCRRRFLAFAALVTGAAGVLYVVSLAPDLLEQRFWSDANITARLSQQQQTLEMFASHPVLGVGLTNFNNAVSPARRYSPGLLAAEPLDYPHNNLGAVLAETGVAGFVPYVCSQILLVLAFWRVRARSPRGRLVWRYFGFVMLAYWITGLSLSSGYHSDLNFWFLFALALMYRVAVQTCPTCVPAG